MEIEEPDLGISEDLELGELFHSQAEAEEEMSQEFAQVSLEEYGDTESPMKK